LQDVRLARREKRSAEIRAERGAPWLEPEYLDGEWGLRVRIGASDFRLDLRAPGQDEEETAP